MAERNGNEEAIKIEQRTSTAAVESAEYEFDPKLEGVVVMATTDVDCTLRVLPKIQGDFRNPLVEKTIMAGESQAEVFLFQTGNIKIEMEPVSQPNNFGAAVRTVSVS